MFDIRNAFRSIEGHYGQLRDLEDKLRAIQIEHLGDVPPELGTRELLSIARSHNWLEEKDSGDFEIRVP